MCGEEGWRGRGREERRAEISAGVRSGGREVRRWRRPPMYSVRSKEGFREERGCDFSSRAIEIFVSPGLAVRDPGLSRKREREKATRLVKHTTADGVPLDARVLSRPCRKCLGFHSPRRVPPWTPIRIIQHEQGIANILHQRRHLPLLDAILRLNLLRRQAARRALPAAMSSGVPRARRPCTCAVACSLSETGGS